MGQKRNKNQINIIKTKKWDVLDHSLLFLSLACRGTQGLLQKGIIPIEKNMKKKCLPKQPCAQPFQHLEYSSFMNHSHKTELKARATYCRPGKAVPYRLKTEPPPQPSLQPKSLKRRESSVNSLKKGRHLAPSNKENLKLQKNTSLNRFTFNQYRVSQFLEKGDPTKLESTLFNNRLSESKHIQRASIQKFHNKANKYKLPSPSRKNNFPITNLSFQTKLHNRFQSKANLTHVPAESQLYPQQPLGFEDVVIEEQIGSGTFGKVYSGRIKQYGAKVAVKRVQQEKKYKTRQLEMVKMLESPFIVKVLGTYTTTEGKYQYLNVVMESYESNFFELLRQNNRQISNLEIKYYTYQMLRGLLYIHGQGVCHRDLKPQNMLVKNKKLVICDFGSAKVLRPGEQNISYICSRCYRAPELIFESTNYTTQIDMWSLGCIFLEIMHGRPLFIADSSLNHILEVIKVLGTPTKDDVMSMNPNYEIHEYDLPTIKPKSFKNLFPATDPLFIDLAERLVRYDPCKRLTASEALAHPFYDELREQRVFRNLSGKCKSWQDFFDFSKEVLPITLRQKLVPKWYTSSL